MNEKERLRGGSEKIIKLISTMPECDNSPSMAVGIIAMAFAIMRAALGNEKHSEAAIEMTIEMEKVFAKTNAGEVK